MRPHTVNAVVVLRAFRAVLRPLGERRLAWSQRNTSTVDTKGSKQTLERAEATKEMLFSFSPRTNSVYECVNGGAGRARAQKSGARSFSVRRPFWF